ncbi:hypothetical protein DRP04_12940 [Archaeoglobales archaeon]|nr:MAG: hypothetical protein DRP04_12940 [Archaeoglobales archaeon]
MRLFIVYNPVYGTARLPRDIVDYVVSCITSHMPPITRKVFRKALEICEIEEKDEVLFYVELPLGEVNKNYNPVFMYVLKIPPNHLPVWVRSSMTWIEGLTASFNTVFGIDIHGSHIPRRYWDELSDFAIKFSTIFYVGSQKKHELFIKLFKKYWKEKYRAPYRENGYWYNWRCGFLRVEDSEIITEILECICDTRFRISSLKKVLGLLPEDLLNLPLNLAARSIRALFEFLKTPPEGRWIILKQVKKLSFKERLEKILYMAKVFRAV